ncbi:MULTISPECIES: YadA-like family protein [unclassified Bartonella]|uniref:YadA-like family protein n=1 Tax=unclassified Bartonella TaxID=2645622 RepID=UPI0035CEBD25
MKKLYTKLAGSDLKFSRFSFVKVLSLATAATFLSNVTPVFSANPDFRNTFLEGVNSAGVSYPQSIISVAGLNTSSVSKDNYLTALNQAGLEKINAVDDYANFLTKTLSGVSDYSPVVNVLMADSKNVLARTLDAGGQYKKSLVSPRSFVVDSSLNQQLAQDDENTDIINVSNILRSGSTEGMQRDVSGSNVIFGEDVDAKTVDSVVIGYKAKAVLAEGDKELAASVIIGSKSEIHRGGSVAVGADIVALKNDAVAVGRFVRVEVDSGTALGFKSQVKVAGGVAIGSNSVANRAAGVPGYTSVLQGPAKNEVSYWKSTLGAVSVGDVDAGKTRQITGVAAGSEDADAVNLRQLQDLEDVVRKNGWKLSVDGKNAKTVIMNSGVDFSTGSTNLNITKGDKDNNVKFDLAQDVTLTSLKAGTNTFDATGLVITNGPKITTGGIDAGNKKVTGVTSGDLSADSQEAVNGSQLNVVATHIAGYLGGGVKFTNGQWDNPEFKIKTLNPETNEIEEESFPNVAKAFEGVGKSYVNLHNEIKKATDGSVFKWHAETESITIAASEGKGGQESIAIGKLSSATANNGIALGGSANVSGENSIALGGFANASGENSIALGGLSAATAKNSMALGSNVQVLPEGGVAVGYKSVSRNSVSAVGYDPSIGSQSTDDGVIWKSTQGAFSVGDAPNKITRQLTGVAAGYADTDAVNIAQLKKLREFVAQGWTLSLNDKVVSNFQPGDILNLVSGSKNFEIKNSDTTDNKDKKITFDLAQDVTLNSVKLKDITLDKTGLTIENGPKVIADGIDAAGKKITGLAGGDLSTNSTDAVNGGQLYTITGDLSKILGGDVSFDGKNFKVPEYKLSNIDEKGEVTDKPHTDVGSAFKGLDDNIKNVNARIKEVSEGVAQDSLSWSDGDKAFVALHGEGDDRKASKITSLAVGDITKESTDAVNGSQLYSLGDKVAKYFSNDAEYKDGELNVPDFKLKTINDDGTEAESSYNNVSDAFSGVGKLFTKVQNAISDVISNLLVTKNEDVINIGKGVEGSEINIANKSDKDRTLSGVKAAEKDNEAVNKGQLDKGLKDLSDTLLSDSSSVVLYDKTTDDQTDYTNVTFGKGKDATPVALHNVAAGSIAENSTDVINGGQVHILSMDIAKLLGGDAEFKDGAFKGPTYNLSSIDKGGEVTDKPHTDVGSAFKGLDDNIKNVNARIKEVSEGVAQDSLSWSDGDKAFVALHGEGEDRKASKITSLAAGSIASGSSDAVNGGQIYDLNQSLAKYFGGDAKYDGDGWDLPGFKIMSFQEDGSFEEEDYDSIAAAFAGVNKVFKNLHNEISENIEQNALLWSDDAGAFIAQHEKEGKKENSKITFLAKGKISEDSTDAINGGQIYTLQQTFASYFGGGAGYDKEGNWQGPKFTVQVFNKDGTKGDKEERNSVSEAFDVVNDSMSTINDRIKEVEKDTSSNSLNWNEEKGSYDASHVDAQGVKSPSKIINVADGKVDRDSKEAVNGGQLWETQQMITDQVKDIENKVTEGSVQYDKDKKTGKKTNKVTLVGGDDSSPVLIANVADGKIEKDSKEAVNGGQLKDKMDFVLESANKYTDEQVSHLVKDGVSEANSYTDMKFSTLSYAVEDVRKEARQAAAVGLAVAGLRYSDIPGKLTIAFGSGLWRSQSAFAFGAGYTSENGDIGSNLSITTSGGHWGISTGINVILN